MSKPETVTKTFALYYSYGDFNSQELHEVVDWLEADKDYLRISEPQELIFTLLPHEEIVKKQIKSLTEKKAKVQADAQRRVTTIEGEIQNLLALPSLSAS